MPTALVSRLYKTGAETQISWAETVTGNTPKIFEVTVADAVTNGQYAWTCDQSTLQSVCIYSSRAVTIKTNDSGTPQETITLVAGENRIWSTNEPDARCPFSNDVTALFITNASGAAASIKIHSLEEHPAA